MGDAVLWLPSEATTSPSTSDNVSDIGNLTVPGPRALADGSVQPEAVCEGKRKRGGVAMKRWRYFCRSINPKAGSTDLLG
jgi:hypothetical protein